MSFKRRRAQLNKQGLTFSKGVNETIENLLQSAHLLKKGRGQGEMSTHLQIELLQAWKAGVEGVNVLSLEVYLQAWKAGVKGVNVLSLEVYLQAWKAGVKHANN